VPCVVGVPLTIPVVLTERPGGRPDALKVREEPSGSVADNGSVTRVPLTEVREPGFVRVGA
jgi:hypothetical protein